MLPYFIYDQIHFGPIAIYTWGFFVGLSFSIGLWLTLYQTKKKGIEASKIFHLSILMFSGGLIGGRLGYVLQFPKYYFSHHLEIFQVWTGGLMFYGGLLGALLLGWLYLKFGVRFGDLVPKDLGTNSPNQLSFGLVADLIAPAAALGISIGYIGCSLINDHQGAITTLPWGILWPDNTLRHPVAQYLALNSLIIFSALWLLRRRFKKPGQLFILFLLWSGLSRFLLDFTRAADTALADPHYWNLTISQWVSLGIIGIILLTTGFKKQPRKNGFPIKRGLPF